MTSFWGVDHGDTVSKSDKKSMGFISNATGAGNKVRVASGSRSALMGTKSWEGLSRTEGSAMERVSTGRKGKRGQSVESFKGVSKSFWGVEHGGEISKSDKARRHIAANTAFGASPKFGGTLSGGYAALTAKKGRKLGAAATSGASTIGGSILGGVAGMATRRPAGIVAGGMAGGAGGSYLGAVNNVQQGRVTGVKAQKYPMERSRKRS